ncbi:MAG: 16S rRNA (cytosine(1402)-N(4))-methyltransferase RsmH [Bacilli bacterium]|nr:16S rRNA (cytosine(1402)-N(4))-methyltransferase RsmH [Bacilli bacterium]
MYHKSVLLKEVIENLKINPDGIYVDATLGYAGHSSEILKRLKKGHLYGFDQDDFAISKSDEKLKTISNHYTIIRSNFSNLKEKLGDYQVDKVDGILFDLGVSSVQIDEAERGFSFHQDAKLDMRMDTTSSFSAYDVVNTYSYQDLVRILRDYGEEKYATSIARNIIKEREKQPIETTFQLVDIIKMSMPMKAMRDGHPARKTFQAIRIEVNHELDVLKIGLKQALDLLAVEGRCCVISFHSLEDRIVKNMFQEYSSVPQEMRNLPFIPEEYLPKYKVISKGIVASREELNENTRAHSARLRVIERIK